MKAPTQPPQPSVRRDPDSTWHKGYSIVSGIPLRAFIGKKREDGEAFAGLYVYQFPSRDGAQKALLQVAK